MCPTVNQSSIHLNLDPLLQHQLSCFLNLRHSTGYNTWKKVALSKVNKMWQPPLSKDVKVKLKSLKVKLKLNLSTHWLQCLDFVLTTMSDNQLDRCCMRMRRTAAGVHWSKQITNEKLNCWEEHLASVLLPADCNFRIKTPDHEFNSDEMFGVQDKTNFLP